MSDTTDFCSNCGTNLEPTATACPSCGAPVHGAPAAPSPKGLSAIVAFAKAKPGTWIGGAVVVVGVVAFVVLGGMFGPSGKAICTASLDQARAFGVISPSAVLDSSSAKSTDVKNRKSCVAKAGDDSFTLVADIKSEDAAHRKCRDYVKQSGCIALYSVARSDGMTTYQVREIPPGETDEALANEGVLGTPPAPNPAQQNGAAPNAVPAGDQGAGLDTETAVDNSGGMQGPPAQQQAVPPPPQQ